ncbi:MAG: hypothetical protein WC551_09755 [Patescibacteria group bacterium]
MDEEKRFDYLLLSAVELPFGNCRPILCAFCTYLDTSELSWGCKMTCLSDYTLKRVRQGGDCWAFEPRFSRETAVDLVGIWLNCKRPDWKTVPCLAAPRKPKPPKHKRTVMTE